MNYLSISSGKVPLKLNLIIIWSKYPIVIKWLLQFHGFKQGFKEFVHNWREHKFALDIFFGNSDDPKANESRSILNAMAGIGLNMLDAAVATDKRNAANKNMDRQRCSRYDTRRREAGKNIATALFGILGATRRQ